MKLNCEKINNWKKDENKNKRTIKGITLIALVITIIVLLILAGVSIAMLTGENGILGQATVAKKETEIAEAKEQVQLEISNWKAEEIRVGRNTELTNSIIESVLNNAKGKNNENYIGEVKADRFTTKKSGYEILYSDLYNSSKIIAGIPVIENAIYTDEENKEAVIPKRFKISTEPTEQKISTGLVIIGPDDSQFVWVPVDKETLCTDGTDDKEIAEISSGENYRGVLYDFTGTDDSVTSTKIAYNSNGRREPDIVSDYDSNTIYLSEMNAILGTNFSTSDDFKKSLQQEYNNIIGSIKTNGGFYVGRYESSISGETIKSISGVKPMSAEDNSQRWYGLYAKERAYGTKLNNDKGTNIKSTMIYGSTYDSILNWALNGTDKNKVTAKGNGNNSGSVVNCGDARYSNDKINNIYDLEGNLIEWNTEAYSTVNRAVRGRLLWQ